MKKSFKRILSLGLALVMVFAMGISASAAARDEGWGTWREYGTWGNWNESDDDSSVAKTLTSDPAAYYMIKRSSENHEMAPSYYMEKSFFPSTIPGVYAISTVPIAVRTPAWKMLQNYSCGVGESLLARFYDLPERSTNAKAALEAAAASTGGKLIACFDGSVAKVKEGAVVSELADAKDTFELAIGIPSYLGQNATSLVAIRVKAGGVCDILNDTYPDTDVLTIDTTPGVASYGVVVLENGAAAPAAVAAPAAPAATTPAPAVTVDNSAFVNAMSESFLNTLTPEQLVLLMTLATDPNKFTLTDADFMAFLSTLSAEQYAMLITIGSSVGGLG